VWGLRSAVAGVLVVVAVAGCGGDAEPTAGERRAAMERWRERADAACTRAVDEISRRGEPVNAMDVDRIAGDAAADLRRAASAIRRLEPPPGSQRRVRALRAAIGRLERPLGTLERWSAVGKKDEMVKAIVALRDGYSLFQRASARAGLRDCGRPEHSQVAIDGLLAPIYGDEFAELYETLMVDLRAIRARAAVVRGRAGLERWFEDLRQRIYEAAIAMDQFEAPRRAEPAAQEYQDVLWSMERVYRNASEQARSSPLTRARIEARVASLLRRLERDEQRAALALARDLEPLPQAGAITAGPAGTIDS
jgi:hypothetical protein